MIFLSTMAIGIAAGMTRSAFAIALVALLIPLVFVMALILPPAPASLLPLATAVIGFNIGLVDLLLVLFACRKAHVL
ncbi:hypothetical protein J5N58_12555 [Rhizobium cremeum]|uniref:hypothetical protein n=2 Tax=Rhizobium cremeum TaxID=2813827 RepID=UPI000DD6E8E3|nr:hypothetical protein [Rhizobium cremeum]MCJ8000507.1 hypothetical protein [Rhizobium cremeum]